MAVSKFPDFQDFKAFEIFVKVRDFCEKERFPILFVILSKEKLFNI